MSGPSPTAFLPIWNGTQFFDDNGNVLAGGLIWQYQGGSYTVQQTTFSGPNTGTSPNTNPIVLDENGRIPTEMWGYEGLYYNLVLEGPPTPPSLHGLILMAEDNIIGIEASSVPTNPSTAISVWNASSTPTYVSGTEFLLVGNVVSNYAVGNRVQFINGVGTYGYGTVTAVSYTSPNTYVTIQPDTIAIGSNLSAVFWSSLVATGITVDAGAVSYSTDLTYSNLATVGGQISALDSAVAVLQTPSGVTPGTYKQANITVNAAGDVTAASTGLVVTTKGDLEGFSTVPVRIPVGSDGEVLTANSSNANGVQWEAPFNASLVNGAATTLTRTGVDGFIADPDLSISLEANVVYNITVMFNGYSPSAGVYMGLYYSGTATAGLYGIQWNIGSGGNFGGAYGVGTSYLFASGWTNEILIVMNCTIRTLTAGTFSVNWGNGGAGGNSMVRYAGSGISAVEVA